MAFEIVGKLHKKFETESKSATFQVREFVLEVMDGNYPQMAKFQLAQERCNLIDSYNEGEEIKVHFDLRGREWQGKYFTTLNCWRIEKPNGETAKPVQQAAAVQKQTPPPTIDDAFPTAKDAPATATNFADDDLPF